MNITDNAFSLPKAGISTLGCKVNQCESAALAEELQKCFEIVPFNSPADIYIINTCTVTAFSDMQARQMIRRAHRNNPRAKILVTGCYAQTSPEKIAAIEGVTLVIGNNCKSRIPELLKNNTELPSPIITDDILRQKKFSNMPAASFPHRTRAFLKIQDGCNSFCSYCIVPLARGASRSLPSPEVLEAVTILEQKNYKEIVITGIHLGTYGHDLEPATSLPSLLRQITGQIQKARIRLSSIEPREITSELLDILRTSSVLCPHLHIPLQSGDDNILRLMQRNYDAKFYRNLIEKICSTISDIAIGVDVMVGFPSETEQQFKNTLTLLQDLPVAYLHVFPYSARPETPAREIRPQVPDTVKKERAAILRNLSTKKREDFALRFIGKPLQVLVEKAKDKKTGFWKGFSQNYLPFLLAGSADTPVNTIVTVQAEKYLDGKLYGKIIS